MRSKPAKERPLLLTMTQEPFQPVRLYYRIPSASVVIAKLRRLACMAEDPVERCWQWLYHGEAKSLRFVGAGYDDVPEERQPIILGRIRFPKSGGMTLQTNSIERAVAATSARRRGGYARPGRRLASVARDTDTAKNPGSWVWLHSQSHPIRHQCLVCATSLAYKDPGSEPTGEPPMTDPKDVALREAEFLLYQTEDGRTRVEVRFGGETAWLSLSQMAELFQRDKSVISRHVKNVFEEGELTREATVAEFATVQREGGREVTRQVEYYNLDVIISVGYRVKSHRGTQFRIWATQRLREYIVKGFTLDDERLKRAGGGNYFDELLVRIRDIRSSEKVFWRKVLEIYATSIDYDPSAEASQRFFATVQNKMHWAAHGQTAAEVISARADSTQPNMGLTSWIGERPRKADAVVAKNYLHQSELEALNRIVNAYLEFAELQALDRKPMYMADWIRKLDDFLHLSDREILTHAGKVSHDAAVAKAEFEYERFSSERRALPSPVDQHFEEAIGDVKRLEKQRAGGALGGGKKKPKPKPKGKK